MRFILNLFRRYSEYPTQLGVSDFCRYDEGEIAIFFNQRERENWEREVKEILKVNVYINETFVSIRRRR